jgi:FeS assembly SUF system protein
MHPKITDIGMSRLNPHAAEQPPAEPNPPAAAAPPETPPAPTAPAADLTPEQIKTLEEEIIKVLCTCFDPEIPVNVYELGLIYDIDIRPSGAVGIRMTLTSPACPVAGSLPPEVEGKVRRVPGVASAKVDVVWDPPWTPKLMSEAAKLQLGLDDY